MNIKKKCLNEMIGGGGGCCCMEQQIKELF